MADWTLPFESSFRFMRVSRRTGLEVSRITNILDGGSIERNLDTTVKESGSLTCVGALDIGADLLRVYLDAKFDDGSTTSEPLGTFLASTDSRTTDGTSSTADVSLMGRLSELEQSDFMQAFSVSPGTSLVSVARGIIEDAGLECTADDSEKASSERLYYGVSTSGDEAAADGSKLVVVNDLLARAGFDSARTDAMGRVALSRSKQVPERPVAWEFAEGRSARFLRTMDDETDTGNVANVVRAVYRSEDGSTVIGYAEDGSGGPWSLSSLGRAIVRTETYDGEATQAEADAKAAELLASSQSPVRKIKLTHTYAPVSIADAVRIDYRSGGVSTKASIRTMRLGLTAGCPTETEARTYER